MTRNPSLHITVAVAVLAVLGAVWIGREVKTSDAERLQNITYEEARPYLEARYTVREGRIWLCTPTNFTKVKQDTLLERLSRETAEIHLAGDQKLTPLIDVSVYGNEDSPWGSFREPRVKSLMIPAFEKARRTLLTELTREARHEQVPSDHAGDLPREVRRDSSQM